MSGLDWMVLISTTAFIVFYGIWKTRKERNMESYIKGGHASKWWTIGLSVMATQASAITFLSTPGQAFTDGMGFVQFYFGLPIAMVIICVFFIPRFFRMKVYTVYEFLENRFDLKTRLLAAFLFLLQRGLGAGITIFAPSIILSSILGWNLNLTILAIGATVTLYTLFGGTGAVSASHKFQMLVMMGGIFLAFVITLHAFPEGIGFTEALQIAGSNNRLNVVDFGFDWNSRYTFWSGIAGGTFLSLAYFGTDQSQAQRYISGQSIRQSRLGLLFNAVFKIPMQFAILLTGVMVFVFYQFQQSPLFFNSYAENQIQETASQESYMALQDEWTKEHDYRQTLYPVILSGDKKAESQQKLEESITRENALRAEARDLIEKSLPEVESNDKDYIFIRFILDFLPKGIIGLLIAAIMAGGMSSTASELNALSSTTTIDFYKRLVRSDASEKHFINASKLFTLMWGLIAISFATFGSLFENLIQFVNIVGSIFYGTVLGIFLSAFFIQRLSATGVFIGALIAQAIVLMVFLTTDIGFLWYNVIGCSAVILFGIIADTFLPASKANRQSE